MTKLANGDMLDPAASGDGVFPWSRAWHRTTVYPGGHTSAIIGSSDSWNRIPWGAMVLSPDQKRLLLDAARETIQRTLREPRPPPPPPPLPRCCDPGLLRPGGCFVGLHERGTHRLRGCVGRVESSRPLWSALHYAAGGVLEDPRFRHDPVRRNDLPRLDIEISVLSPMRPAASPLDFDPQLEGVYLIHAGRSGCFLPQVARETGWGREQLLSRLCTEKLGVAAGAWRDPGARLLVFTTLLIGPEEFGQCSNVPDHN
jgi:AmmeMemoRadiSam system protein A